VRAAITACLATDRLLSAGPENAPAALSRLPPPETSNLKIVHQGLTFSFASAFLLHERAALPI